MGDIGGNGKGADVLQLPVSIGLGNCRAAFQQDPANVGASQPATEVCGKNGVKADFHRS